MTQKLLTLLFGIMLTLLPGAVRMANVSAANKPQFQKTPSATPQVERKQQTPPPAMVFFKFDNPAGGAEWLPGTTQTIRWRCTGLSGQHFKIALYYNGAFQRVIAQSAAPGANGQGALDWAIPSGIYQGPENYTIEISSVEQPNTKFMSAAFRIQGRLQLTQPAANAAWQQGSTRQIHWTYEGNPCQNVALGLYRNGSLICPITGSAPVGSGGEGFYNWVVPNDLTPGPGYTILLQAHGHGFIKSWSAPFTVSAQPDITISEPPAAHPHWQPGTTHVIRWQYGLPGAHVKISLLRMGQPVDELATALPAEDGLFNWTIPAGLPPSDHYAIEVQSVERPAIRAVSPLSIAGTLTVTNPAANGTEWLAGSTETIRWTTTGNIGQNVKLTLMVNGQPGPVIIPSIAASAGMAAWDIPADLAPNFNYAIRVESVDYPMIRFHSPTFRIITQKIIIESPTTSGYYYTSWTLPVNGMAYGCERLCVTLINNSTNQTVFNTTPHVNDNKFATAFPLENVPEGVYKILITNYPEEVTITATVGPIHIFRNN